jgi:hypothetical protein
LRLCLILAKAKATEAVKNLEAAAKDPPAQGERDAGDALHRTRLATEQGRSHLVGGPQPS